MCTIVLGCCNKEEVVEWLLFHMVKVTKERYKDAEIIKSICLIFQPPYWPIWTLFIYFLLRSERLA